MRPLRLRQLQCASGPILVLGVLGACNSDAHNSAAPLSTSLESSTPAVVDEIPTPAASPVPPAPEVASHNYDEREEWTYYYVAAVSEEDRKRGRAVGSVHAFQYLGRNALGEHIIASIRSDGTVSYRAKCAASCRIIHTDNGDRIAYAPASIIGAAFEDAFRGKLRVAEWAKDEAVPTQAPAVQSNGASTIAEGPAKVVGTNAPEPGGPPPLVAAADAENTGSVPE